MIPLGEQELVERAKTDPEAFGCLFDTYYPPILRYCIKRTGDMAMAEDITAETFVKAYKNIDRFEWQGVSISAWFYKIATNEIRSYFRKSRYTTTSLDELLEQTGFELASDEDVHQELVDAQDQLARDARFIEAQQCLATLSLRYQEVIALRYIERKKISEIALILGKREGTVKSLLSRGIVKLRARLQPEAMQLFQAKRVVDSEGENNNPRGIA